MDEDVIGGRVSLAAEDGERRNFHRSAQASPATCGHAGHFTRYHDNAGHSLTSRLCRVPGDHAEIVVAAKGFDSTGSKLTDAVREIEEMADVRLPRQYVMAVIDGIGWKSRRADLKRIYALWARDQINGMYTLANIDQFRDDLEDAARRLRLL
jgi:hypothetical protein